MVSYDVATISIGTYPHREAWYMRETYNAEIDQRFLVHVHLDLGSSNFVTSCWGRLFLYALAWFS
jgi:hypothetical protein